MMKKMVGFLIGLMMCATSLKAQQLPPDATQETPFGKVQLVSCTTALRVTGPLYLGVRALSNDNWRLDEPQLTVTTSNNMPVILLSPFEQPYSDNPVYPISAVLTHKPTEPVTFTVSGSWRACNEQECLTYPIHLERTLAPGTALIAPECTGITLALSNTPIPMYMKQIKAHAKPDGDNINVVLDFQQVPRTLTLYDAQKQQIQPEIEAHGKRATFMLPNSFASESKLHFFARTHYHFYEVVVPVSNEPAPLPPVSIFQILQAGFLFFFLSAIPIYWARTTKTTQKKFHAQTKQTLWLCAVGILICCGFLIYRYCVDSSDDIWTLITPNFSKTTLLIIMALALIFAPMSPILAFFFTFIAPHPYMIDQSGPLVEMMPLLFFFVLTACAFALQLLFEEKIFKELQKTHISKLWWCARLPWIGLMLYICFYL